MGTQVMKGVVAVQENWETISNLVDSIGECCSNIPFTAVFKEPVDGISHLIRWYLSAELAASTTSACPGLSPYELKAASLAVGYVSYHVVEKASNAMFKRLFRQEPAPDDRVSCDV